MKYRYSILFFFIGYLIQSTVMVHFIVFGVSPNLVLCLVILFPFLYGNNQGMVLGILFGLLQDINFSLMIGPSAISYLIVALIMGYIKRLLYRESILTIFFAAAIGTTLYYTLHWIIITIFGGTYHFLYIIKELPILIVYHFLIMVVYYLLIGKKVIRYNQDRYYSEKPLLLRIRDKRLQ